MCGDMPHRHVYKHASCDLPVVRMVNATPYDRIGDAENPLFDELIATPEVGPSIQRSSQCKNLPAFHLANIHPFCLLTIHRFSVPLVALNTLVIFVKMVFG